MKTNFIIILFIGCIAAFTRSFAQVPDDYIKARIDSLVLSQMQKDKAVGVALGVVKNGKIFYTKGYGTKELNTNKTVDSLTNFHLASISKVFVATAVMQLVEQGKIRLDAKLLSYVPVDKLKDERFRNITIKQMLTHMSGFPDVRNYHWAHPKNDSLALGNLAKRSIEEKRLLFDPGTKFEYSNLAFEVLGHVIEAVTGKNFDDYESAFVLSKAGLDYSNFDYHQVAEQRRSTPHIKRLGKVKASKIYPYNREHGPSSTLNSCTYDMCKWMLEMFRIYSDTTHSYNGVISRKTLLHMWSAQHSFYPGGSIGLAWFLHKSPMGMSALHDGGDRGYSSLMTLFPEHNIGVIMLVNGDYVRALYETPWSISWMASGFVIQRVQMSQTDLETLQGQYVSTNLAYGKRRITFKVISGELTGNDNGYRYRLIPVGEGKFINPEDGASLLFNAKNTRDITLLLFESIEFKKVN